MLARSPIDEKIYYFVDKYLPFRAAISCSHFQRFSNAVLHIVRWMVNQKYWVDKPLVNYLDDYLFIALLKAMCDNQIRVFLDICEQINFPVALEKTFWGTTSLTFLSLLIDMIHQLVMLPKEKIEHRCILLQQILNKPNRKATVHELQKLCGFLNFLGKAIVPGRAFTCRMYAYTKSNILKPHHHVRVNKELRKDLEMWTTFWHELTVFSRPGHL